MRVAIIAGLAMALAACGGQGSDNQVAANDGTAQPEASTTEAGAHATGETPANQAAPTGNSAEPTAMSIPATIQGRWGLVPADCTSTRGDAKGLLEISDKQLRFYESRGTLKDVVEANASRIVADFDMTGEGQSWDRRMSLDAQDAGKTLIRGEQGADAMPGVLKYRRCEG